MTGLKLDLMKNRTIFGEANLVIKPIAGTVTEFVTRSVCVRDLNEAIVIRTKKTSNYLCGSRGAPVATSGVPDRKVFEPRIVRTAMV